MKTEASIDWSKLPILNARPEGMSQEDYQLHRKAYKYLLKLYKTQGHTIKGTVIGQHNGESGTSVD